MLNIAACKIEAVVRRGPQQHGTKKEQKGVPERSQKHQR